MPFGTRELTEEELANYYEGENIPPNAPREVPVKQDADSYILSEEIYRNLKEKHFIVWLAEKQFATASSLLREINCVNHIGDLLRYVKDQFVYEQCIEQLSKIYGKARLWKDAVTQARNQAKRAKQPTMMDKQQEETDALRQLNLFVRNNC